MNQQMKELRGSEVEIAVPSFGSCCLRQLLKQCKVYCGGLDTKSASRVFYMDMYRLEVYSSIAVMGHEVYYVVKHCKYK